MLLRTLVTTLPSETYFPLKKTYDFNDSFYSKDEAFQSLVRFSETYFKWYTELANNKRAFAPLHYDNPKQMEGFVKGIGLDASDDSYYLLKMIQASNNNTIKKEHSNKFRFFLQFAHEAINYYTSKLNK